MPLRRLRQLHTALATSESAHADAKRRLSECSLALDAARRAFDTTEQETLALGRSCEALRSAISEARLATRYSAFLPAEILSLIFAHAVGRSAATTHRRLIDWSLVTLRHTLRLVCKRWDSIALETPEFWTYVVVPATLEFVARPGFPAYVALQLKRSGSLPLALVIDAQYDHDTEQALFESSHHAMSLQANFLQKAFDVLVADNITSRIAMLSVTGGPPNHADAHDYTGQGNIRDLTIELLRSSTPLLEEAYLHMDRQARDADEPWPTSEPDHPSIFFPVAPNLRVLELVRMPVTWSLPHPGLPSLEKLVLTFRFLPQSCLAAIITLCPALREIESRVDKLGHQSFPAATMPHVYALSVTSLVMGWENNSSSIFKVATFPKVASLKVQTPVLFEDDLHLRLAPTLTNLCWEDGDDLGASDINKLGNLALLESVTIWPWSGIDLAYLVERLCNRHDRMWPRLKHIEIGGSLGDSRGEELVRLARDRAFPRVDNTGSVAVAALGSIKINRCEVANWVLEQLRIIMGEDRVVYAVGPRNESRGLL